MHKFNRGDQVRSILSASDDDYFVGIAEVMEYTTIAGHPVIALLREVMGLWYVNEDTIRLVKPEPVKTPEQLKKEPVTIGSDPEFLFIDKNNREVPANEILPASQRTSCEFGTDGHSSTAEIRPKPATEPLTHVKNIKDLFIKYRLRDRNAYKLDFRAYDRNEHTGGHIHLGHPLLKTDRTIRSNVSLALDSLLSFPLMFVEDTENAINRKCNSSYGQLGDMREQEYGIEYRTPASWLSSERLARAVLTLAYAITYDTIILDHHISKPPATIRGFRDAYNHHNTDLLRPYLHHAIAEIRKLSLYPKYKNDINYLLYHAVRGDDLQTTEIKKGWHIPYTRTRKVILFTLMELVQLLEAHLTDTKTVPERYTFVSINSMDYMIPEIAKRLNRTLNNILSKKIEGITDVQPVSLFGLDRERGNKIVIQYNPSVYPVKRIHRLERIITDTASAFGYEGLTIERQRRLIASVRTVENHFISPIRLGLGRPLREHGSYLPELITFLTLCYSNNGIYRSFQVNKKTGKPVNIHVLTRSLIKTIAPLVKKTKKLPVLSDQAQAVIQ